MFDFDDVFLFIDGRYVPIGELLRYRLNSDDVDVLSAFASGFLSGRRLLDEKAHEKK